jgi:3-oxoacyl-[acyl-carrier protein] reductase
MMFSKTLANEVVGSNIRVNTINPGLVLTPDWIKSPSRLPGKMAGRRICRASPTLLVA